MLSPSTTVEIYSTNVINIGSVLEYVRARVYHFSPLCKLPPVWFDGMADRAAKKGPPSARCFPDKISSIDFCPVDDEFELDRVNIANASWHTRLVISQSVLVRSHNARQVPLRCLAAC